MTELSRRSFIWTCTGCALGAAAPAWAATSPTARTISPPPPQREAMFWEKTDSGIACTTCPNHCAPEEGGTSLCRTRTNRGGKLYTMTYGRPCLIVKDPIAKNPLYHVDPGADAIGVATAGCNLTCKYCQNWEISQVGPDRTKNINLSPAEVVAKAVERKLKWITFSYTEPVAYLEYALDTAKLAQEKGLKVAVATAGFISEPALNELIKHTTAFSVTLKGYTDEFYKEVCGCSMSQVWKSIDALSAARKWFEVVTLIVPGLNDSESGLKSLASRLAGINRDIPLHFLRFAPAYKLKHLQQTPVQTLERARNNALQAGLKFVYIDLPGHEAANTNCPSCRDLLVERSGFAVLRNTLRGGKCPRCSAAIPGLWS